MFFMLALRLLILTNRISSKYEAIEGSYPKFLKLQISIGFSISLIYPNLRISL